MSRRKSPPPRHGKRKSAKSPAAGSPSWLYGVHTAIAILANPARRYSRIVTCDAALAARIADILAAAPQIAIETITRDVLDAMLPDGAVHQGIAVLAAPLKSVPLEDICDQVDGQAQARIVVLDQVTDPHNIGAILRTAAAFQANAVIVQDRHTPPVTGVLAKAASGGLEHCPLVRVTNLARALENLKRAGVWCIGLDSEATQSVRSAKVSGPMALVLGAEGEGLRRLTRDNCDVLAAIPFSGPLASLNVSNAAAIALYEIALTDA